MFTGIIEEVGSVSELTPLAVGARLRIDCGEVTAGASLGSSIAVNGVCLTVVHLDPASFSADLAPETLQRTNLGALTDGSLVNLEQPLSLNGRLNGHLVQGHVDATATLETLDLLGNENWWIQVRIPKSLERYCIEKGSITLDGISLTIAAIDRTLVSVTIIPHTYEHTAIRSWKPGQQINVEVDLISKYVEKLVRGA